MNLAVHGLEGDIRHGGNVNSYYDDPHEATGKFDFVLANPPFNVNAVDKERLRDAVLSPNPADSLSACPAQTTRTTSGYSCSIRR